MYLKKHIEDDMEYISASDIFEFMNEEDRKTQEIFAFLSIEFNAEYTVYPPKSNKPSIYFISF